jgi:hypothetical protein
MTYSFTQISQYLRCPRQYRYKYLDGWREKEDKASMIFGRCFETALAAYFAREDPTATFFQEWRKYQDSSLAYARNDSWDRLYHQGIHLLERFAQDDRVRIGCPKQNLQVKLTRSLPCGSDFVSYIDAIGEVDGTKCIIDWKNDDISIRGTAGGSPGPRSTADLLFLDGGNLRRCLGCLRSKERTRDSVSEDIH